MAKKVTSAKVASKASAALRDGRTSSRTKSIAGSAFIISKSNFPRKSKRSVQNQAKSQNETVIQKRKIIMLSQGVEIERNKK